AHVAEVTAIRAQKNALLSTDPDATAGFSKEANQKLQAIFDAVDAGLAIAPGVKLLQFGGYVAEFRTDRQQLFPIGLDFGRGDRK
ncbi:hypothetical protein ACC705_34845, partial [Rhizobium ruizarguesonis]